MRGELQGQERQVSGPTGHYPTQTLKAWDFCDVSVWTSLLEASARRRPSVVRVRHRQGDQRECEERRDPVQRLEIGQVVQYDLETRPGGHDQPGRADILAVVPESDANERAGVGEPEDAQRQVAGQGCPPAEVALQLDRAS